MQKLEGFFQFQCQTGQQKIYSKKIKNIFLELCRLIPTQRKLNHSIPNYEVKVMRVFILRAMKVEKTYKVVFCSQF